MTAPLASVVVAVLNEAENVAEVCDEIVRALEPWGPFEIVWVDDGSGDDTPARLAAIAEKDPRVRLVRHERRAPAPIIDLSLFRNSGFLSGSAVIALQNLGMYSLLALVPFYFGAGRDTAGAARVSLAIVAMTAAMAISSPFGGWMADRLGLKTMVVTGGLLGAAGILWLSLLPASASPLAISLRLLVVGLALGVSTGPAQAGALEAEGHVAPDRAMGEEGVVLEHGVHGPLVGGQGGHVPARDHDAAPVRHLEAGDEAQERGLPAAAPPAQHHLFPGGEGETLDVQDRQVIAIRLAIGLADVF